jgi:uncharacterized protein YegP (UPF0339 family)
MTEHPTIKSVMLYKDDKDEWRFKAAARNSETIVVSSEGYHNKQDALGAISGVFGDDVPIFEDQDATKD